jgi:flagellum-specific peptidoglycan hydrolase FlgJ
VLSSEEQSNLNLAAPLALDCENSTKVPALVTLAQWALESEWGTKEPPASNNPFGIKAIGDQPFVESQTVEYVKHVPIRVMQKFRQYPTLKDAFAEHAELLANGTYFHVPFARYLVDRDVTAFVKAIAVHYSTSPTYATQLLAIMNPHVTQALKDAGQNSLSARTQESFRPSTTVEKSGDIKA